MNPRTAAILLAGYIAADMIGVVLVTIGFIIFLWSVL